MPSTSQGPKNGRMSSSKGPRKSVYDTNFAPLGWRESRATMKFPHVNDLLFPEEQKVQKTMSVSACYQAFCLTDSKRMFIRITTRVSPRIIGPAASGWYKGAEWPNLVSRSQAPRLRKKRPSIWITKCSTYNKKKNSNKKCPAMTENRAGKGGPMGKDNDSSWGGVFELGSRVLR